jgi:hypothetical protein
MATIGAVVTGAAEPDIAYVEAVSGHAVQTSPGRERQLDLLDMVSNGAQLDLAEGAELRICHYGLHQPLTLVGPFRGSISRDGVIAQSGELIPLSGQPCSEPIVSIVQGGTAFRGVGAPPRVSLHPAIKLSSRIEVRSATLWDKTRKTKVATFDRTIVYPELEDGRTYQLVIELGDGGEHMVVLRANATSMASVVIVVVR